LSGIRPTLVLSRASRLRYHCIVTSATGLPPTPLPRRASTEVLGVGRSVRQPLARRSAALCSGLRDVPGRQRGGL